jgi:glycosyl transferase family 25
MIASHSRRNRMRPFDAVYVINLPTRRDRRSAMQAQFRKIGVDTRDSRIIFFDAIRPDDAAGFPTIGARGCFLSHLGVLRAARAAGHRRVLILEDDVDFSADFPRRLEALAPALDAQPWDFLYLGWLHTAHPIGDTRPIATLPAENSAFGAHMFALTAATIAALVPYLEAILRRPPGDPEGDPMHVDGAHAWFRRSRPEVRTLLLTKPIGYQRPSRTDIHELKWFDRIPALEPVASSLRWLRGQLKMRLAGG